MVNGREIIRTIIEKPGEEGQEPQQKYYTLQVRTRDDNGAQRTELDVGLPDRIYIDAWIEAHGEGASPVDGGPIQIDLTQGYEYVSMTEGSPFAGGRTVIIQPQSQVPDGNPTGPAVVVVSAPLEGQPFSVPVTITLTRTQYELKFM